MTVDFQTISTVTPNSTWASLPLFNRKGWKRVRFGKVVENCNETCDPAKPGLERFVAMEHLEPGSLNVRPGQSGILSDERRTFSISSPRYSSSLLL